jgi:hypothetical protein
MIRTTAEASNTNFEVPAVAISAGAIQANQIFWGRIKFLYPLQAGQGLQVCYGLAAPLAGITTAGQLQIAEGLLAQAAMVLSRP